MLPRFRILIVDDVEANRMLLADSMFALGHDPQTAENGRVALEQMRSNPPDLVLLDILMPVMDGYTTLQHIRADEKLRHLPVVVISAVDELETVVRCIAAGADDYLVKPFNATLLKARISASLDRKRLHDEEAAARRELEEANALKDKFLQIANHDIRNPLTVLNACLYSLRKESAGDGDARLMEMIATMERAASRIGNIVNDFLDFREISEGRCKLELGSVDLNELVGAIVEESQQYAARKNIGLQFDPMAELPECHADYNRTVQITANYVSNAIKFTPHGESVAVRTLQKDGKVRTEVQDSGPGVSVEERSRLFQEFARLSNRPTGDEKSTGLGLSIVKQLAEMQGGSVGAEFPPHGGSIFWFELPTAGPATPRL
ncbi:MAG: hybrid sensor histidine kinase/response regulator [Candidatus Sumerlaeaceae bacterium]